MRARANDRALKNLGVRELNLGSLPDGAKIVNLPNQVLVYSTGPLNKRGSFFFPKLRSLA